MNYSEPAILAKLAEVEAHIAPYLQMRTTLRAYLAQSREVHTLDDDALITLYLHNRDIELKAATEEAYNMESAVKHEQSRIEDELGMRMKSRKSENTKTGHGTAFFKDTASLKTEDKGEFSRWVIGAENWTFVDWRPSKEAVEEFAEQHNGEPPPGLKLEYITKVHVRKS